ncbi:hypothetical protein GGS23DRAFT_235549 [Durotheca rogersii]|uniref:uncharacterized protein n=1 Tax=Durotheca rogersii TaxID=419775 RepID=UPI00221EF3AF|nr:uncharacterized protein GGS23DRAFT_235549 [Durotheca rogersii]KAI5860402.1 hypothetical protein GGS23DRAFT_235549 [Durotheca rogersii]
MDAPAAIAVTRISGFRFLVNPLLLTYIFSPLPFPPPPPPPPPLPILFFLTLLSPPIVAVSVTTSNPSAGHSLSNQSPLPLLPVQATPLSPPLLPRAPLEKKSRVPSSQ